MKGLKKYEAKRLFGLKRFYFVTMSAIILKLMSMAHRDFPVILEKNLILFSIFLNLHKLKCLKNSHNLSWLGFETISLWPVL
jgi:hypothetical protein